MTTISTTSPVFKSRRKNDKRSSRISILALIALILVASNLRSPLSSVGPVLDDIIRDLALSKIAAGMLTAIPLFAFAAFSDSIGRISSRYSIEKIIFIALLILTIGLYMRVMGGIWSLFVGSVFIGLGICIGNVLMPAFIKQEFPHKIGVFTGIYSVAMNLVAALAAGWSISLGQVTGLGWRGSIGFWVIPSALALLVWIAQLSKINADSSDRGSNQAQTFNIFKSRLAWDISLFMGLQSLMYYCLSAWLPTVLVNYGMDKVDAGWVLSYLQLAMLPVTFLGPIVATRLKNQRPLITILCISMFIGILLICLFKLKYIYLAAILFGISNGLAFGLAMLFFSLRTESAHTAVKISGMSQSIGYLIAACGPPLFGKLFDLTNDWTYSFSFMGLAVLLMAYVGLRSATNHVIENDLRK